jgi:DNA-directed RNA polymerase specialized sigma subunit
MTTVISRLFIDYLRMTAKGRWKASKKALALGREARELEKLVLEKGYNIDQAIETLVENPDYSVSKNGAYKMASELELQKKSTVQKKKRSAKSPNTGNVEVLNYISDGKSISPEKVLINEEILHKKEKIEQSIKEMIKSFTNEERLIIKMKYYDKGKSVSEIARVLNRERSYVDGKLNKIKKEFKNKLLSMGFGIDDVKDVMDFGSANQG